MAIPIEHITLIEDPESVKEFEENMKNPKITKEQIEFIKEAIKLYKEHPF